MQCALGHSSSFFFAAMTDLLATRLMVAGTLRRLLQRLRAREAKERGRRVREDDVPRRLVGYPFGQPVDAIAIRDLIFVRNERPVARPDQLLHAARVEQCIDVTLHIATVPAALTIRRRELDPGVACAHGLQHFPETRARDAARGIRAAEMVDDHARAAVANPRKHAWEQRA